MNQRIVILAILVGALGYCMQVCDDDVVEGVKSATANRNAKRESASTVSVAPALFRDGRPGLLLRATF